MNMNKEIKNSSKFQDLTVISGNDRKATRIADRFIREQEVA
jgi:hypothetical protein